MTPRFTHPWSLLPVNRSKIGLHPLVLLVRRVVIRLVAPSFNESEWAAVHGKCLGWNGSRVLSARGGQEVDFWAVSVIQFTIEGDEVDEA